MLVSVLFLLASPFGLLIAVCSIAEGVETRSPPLVALGACALVLLVAGVVTAVRGLRDASRGRW